MPKVTKQTSSRPVKAGAKATSVLDRIQPLAIGPRRLKLLVYGQSKTGKTQLAGTFPKPMLLLGTEDGTRSIVGTKGMDFVMLRRSEEIQEIVNKLREGGYQSVGLDTAGGFQDILLKEVLDLDEVPIQRTYGMGSGKFKDTRQMWGVIGIQFKEHMRRLLDLADQGIVDVVIIAHERAFQEEATEVIFPHVGAALTPSVAGWLDGACSAICQCYKQRRVQLVEKSIGGKKRKIRVNTDKIDYCLRVGPHDVYKTGIQRARELLPLPDFIVDPTFDKISKLTRQGG